MRLPYRIFLKFFKKERYQDFQLLPPSNETPPEWSHLTLSEVMKGVQDQIEKRYIEMVLKKTRGRVGESAKIAEIHPRALYNKMKRLDIRKEDFKRVK